MVFFMEQLDTTILNTAVPALANALGVSVLSMKAVVASYKLALAVLIPISGWMAASHQHSSPGGLPGSAGLRRRHDG